VGALCERLAAGEVGEACKLVLPETRDALARSLSASPTLSTDGCYVAFWSDASNLVPGDTNGRPDVFVHDRATGETTGSAWMAPGSAWTVPVPSPMA
jgi:hypothetical protein